jgi:hypothetical protein
MNSIERYLLEIIDLFQRFFITLRDSIVHPSAFSDILPLRGTKYYMDARIYFSICMVFYYTFSVGSEWDFQTPLTTSVRGTYSQLTGKSFGEHITTLIPAIGTIIAFVYFFSWILRLRRVHRRVVVQGLLYWFGGAIVLYVLLNFAFDSILQLTIIASHHPRLRLVRGYADIFGIIYSCRFVIVYYLAPIPAVVSAAVGLFHVGKKDRKLLWRLMLVPLVVLCYLVVVSWATVFWQDMLHEPNDGAIIVANQEQYMPGMLHKQVMEIFRVQDSTDSRLYCAKFFIFNTSTEPLFIHKNTAFEVANAEAEGDKLYEYSVTSSTIKFADSTAIVKKIDPSDYGEIEAYFLIPDSLVRELDDKNCWVTFFTMPKDRVLVLDVFVTVTR